MPLILVLTGWFQGPAVGTASDPDAAEISRLEVAWNEAHVRGDVDTLDRLCAEDLAVTVPGMASMTKAESIGVLRAGRMRFVRYETSDVLIRLHDDTAVVTGRLQRTRSMGERSAEDDWRFTKVYARRDGNWQVVAFHASLNPPD